MTVGLCREAMLGDAAEPLLLVLVVCPSLAGTIKFACTNWTSMKKLELEVKLLLSLGCRLLDLSRIQV